MLGSSPASLPLLYRPPYGYLRQLLPGAVHAHCSNLICEEEHGAFSLSDHRKAPENCPPGRILYSVSASDLDFGENAKVTYSILESKVQDVSVSSYVYINSENGSIYSMHSFDYEKLKVFQILVQAKDQGSPSLSSNATVHVFILDLNDNAPAVIYPSSAGLGSLSLQRMPRSAKAAHLVTKVTAVDADSGHNAWISYKVAEATDASLFTVNQYTGEVRTKRAVAEQDDSSQRLLIEIRDDGDPVQSATVTVSILMEDGLHEPILDIRHKAAESSGKTGRLALYLILSLASVSVLSLVTFLILAVKCVKSSRGSCCVRHSDCDDYKNPNRNLQIQLNTDGPITYVEVLGGDMMSQSQSFRSCMSPMSEYSDFTLIKPSSTSDFKEVISVLDASLPDSTWTFESQQAKDQGSPSLSSNATVHVFILDLNDNAPAVIYPSSAGLGSLSLQRMPRSAKAAHLVTKVTAVDADSGHNAWISYKVAEATDASLFTVNQYTGEVRTKRAVAEQDDSSQRLLIEIRDDGDPVQSATVTVSILMEDGLHEPILDIRHKAAESSGKTGRLALYLILSLASVSVLSLVTFSHLSGEMCEEQQGQLLRQTQ
uniref:Cadherin domain-containing protein n=1 Tax=Knipowitschia caucasica TaxID=637954 RepID=A0AAV2MIU4_KNICA